MNGREDEETSVGPVPSAAPASPAERDRTAAALCRHFARDHLEVTELERRLDRAYAARSAEELEAVLADLPDLPAEVLPAPASGPPGPMVEEGVGMAEREVLVGIMGGTEREGAWTPPRHTVAFALMGGAGLDFREARFGAREIRVTAIAIMGGVQVVVAPGVRVEVTGSAFMGGFEGRGEGAPPSPGAPVIRIDGIALMGAVEVTVRLPGESEREARRRRKAERRGWRVEARRLRDG